MTTDPAAALRALEVRGLSVELAGKRVLTGVDLYVGAGELVALIGPNGAGKTTLLRSVLGLIPSQGSIALPSTPADVGYVPQRHEFAWSFPIDVHDAVMSGRVGRIGWFRRPRREDYEAVASALRRVRMWELRRRPVEQLSGGQRQRVLVARALALDPELLLLDEPFTGLDIPSQELLTDLFRDLADEGRAILMTTHDLAGAMRTFDRIYLVNRRVVGEGDPESLRDAAPWVEAFGFRPDSPLLDALGVVTC